MRNIIIRVLKATTLLKFGVFYLTIILLFSGLYSLIPEQFYNSSSKHEYLLDKEANQIKIELQQSIIDNFKAYYGYDRIFLDDDGRWLLNVENLEVSSLLREGQFTFVISIYVTDVSKRIIEAKDESLPQYHTRLKLLLYDDMLRSGKIVYRFGEIQSRAKSSGVLDLDSLDFSQIFYIEGSAITADTIGIRIPVELNDRINTFSNGVNDFSDGVNGNFFRMLYLSMVTITTLGYGDIVPLTNLARILIGLEATVGIIIMGLFVNRILKSE